jgi:transcriptional regulator with XRE-family HTH domain
MKQPELGKKILELRLLKGFTQNELADQCNLSIRTIQRIELGEVMPRSFTIKAIFSVLKYDFYNTNLVSENGKTSSLKDIVLDIFNLKKNTMKKVTFLSVVLALTLFFMIKNESHAQSINGWFISGSKAKSYEIGLDKSVTKSGKKCAYIKSIEDDIKGFGTIMQSCDAKFYIGKRIKMTGFVKTEDVTNRSGMWLRVDSKFEKKYLSFDNMRDRPIKGDSDWTQYEIILNVPKESSTLNYGVLINGTGKVWFDRLSFEILGDITDQIPVSKIPEKPSNIDFEE